MLDASLGEHLCMQSEVYIPLSLIYRLIRRGLYESALPRLQWAVNGQAADMSVEMM